MNIIASMVADIFLQLILRAHRVNENETMCIIRIEALILSDKQVFRNKNTFL